jgi:hypothetical protein
LTSFRCIEKSPDIYTSELIIPQVWTYSIETTAKQKTKLWILGKAGWYEIKPSAEYSPIFKKVLEKALLWTWIEDNKESRQAIESLVLAHPDGRKRAMSLLEEHHRFLIAKMHGDEGSKEEWRGTAVWDWCNEEYPDEIVQVEWIMKRQRSKHAMSLRQEDSDSSDLAFTSFTSAPPVATPRNRVKRKPSATTSRSTRIKKESPAESAKGQSIKTESFRKERTVRIKKEPSPTPRRRSARSSRQEESSPHGETIRLVSPPLSSRRTRLKLESSPDPLDTPDDTPRPHPMFSGKGRMSAQIKRPRSPSPEVEEDPIDEEYDLPTSSMGHYSHKRSGLRPKRPSLPRADSLSSLATPEHDEELQKRFANVNRMLSVNHTPRSPLLSTQQPVKKRLRVSTRNQPVPVDGSPNKPIIIKEEPESDEDSTLDDDWPSLRPGGGKAPVSGSTTLVGFSGGEWSCEMDGCEFKVWEPHTPAGGLEIEMHYEEHGAKMRAAMKVLGVECQPIGERKVE